MSASKAGTWQCDYCGQLSFTGVHVKYYTRNGLRHACEACVTKLKIDEAMAAERRRIERLLDKHDREHA